MSVAPQGIPRDLQPIVTFPSGQVYRVVRTRGWTFDNGCLLCDLEPEDPRMKLAAHFEGFVADFKFESGGAQ